jgi:hypothetical protein
MTHLHARPYMDDDEFRDITDRVRDAQRKSGQKVRSLMAEATWLYLALVNSGRV